jgi:hypothetical protein
MDKFLDLYDLLKLTQEYIKHLNRSTMSNEIEALIENFPAKKNSRPHKFSSEFYRNLMK